MSKQSRVPLLVPLLLLAVCPLGRVSGKIFERCELARLLQHRYGLPAAQVASLVCIAQHSSDLNTAAFGGGTGPGGGSHGLFQISDVYWCSPPGQGAGCGLSCARLRDDDIADDVLCVRKIYAEHQRISGDGFSAWQAHSAYCRQDAASYVAGCGVGTALSVAASYQHTQQVKPNHYQAQAQRVQGKIYNRCELAQELYYQHKLPMPQIPTWVCIAQHESSFNTAAVGRLNADGSADHGLFQISDLFWCTNERRAGKGCQATCQQFLDSSISDDVQCIRRIHQEHTQISGDGFNAWTVYKRNCLDQRYEQVAACFAKPQVIASHPNAIGGYGSPVKSKVSYAYQYGSSQQQISSPVANQYYKPAPPVLPYQREGVSYQGNPFLRPPHAAPQPHPNAIGFGGKGSPSLANPFFSHKQTQHTAHNQQQYQYLQSTTPVHSTQSTQSTAVATFKSRTGTGTGKVFKRCELAQELYFSHKFPMQDIATWVCIAEHESSFNTAAVGRLNADGSADHGLFQISDLYWCTHGVVGGGKACHIECDRLLDSDISDDVQCIRTIHEEHTRLSGDGFNAWTVYSGHCRHQSLAMLSDCFDGNEIEEAQKPSPYAERPQVKPKQAIVDKTQQKLAASHGYAGNPFLQNLLAVKTPQGSAPKEKPTPSASPDSFPSTKPNYDHNPFPKAPGSARPSATSLQSSVQLKPNENLSYAQNPFLHPQALARPVVPARVPVPTVKPSASTKSPQRVTRPYISSDSFRNEVIKFTATSSATTTTTKRPITTTTKRPITTTTKRPITTTTKRPITTTTTTKSTAKTTVRATWAWQTTAKTTTRPPSPTRATTRRSSSTATSSTPNPKTTTRPVTRYQAITKPTTRSTSTTRPATTLRTVPTTRPSTTARPITRYTTVTKPLTRSTTTTARPATTTRPTTTTRPIPSTRPSASTRYTTRYTTRATNRTEPTTRPTTTTRPVTSTQPSASTRTTNRTGLTTRPATTTRPVTSTRPALTTRSTTRYAAVTKTSQRTTARPTTRYTANTLSSTTPRPYLFTSTATTTVPKRSTTADPFSHPFFQKFKAKFENTPAPVVPNKKPTTAAPTRQSQSNTSSSTSSPYYAKYQENKAKVAAKTVFSYGFGQNRTTTRRPESPTTQIASRAAKSPFDVYLNWNKN